MRYILLPAAAQRRLAAAAAGKLGVRPLGAALDDLARRAGLDAHGTGQHAAIRPAIRRAGASARPGAWA